MHVFIERFLRFLMAEKNRSEHTVAAYRGDLAQFSAYLGSESVTAWQDVDQTHILNYLSYLKGKYAPSTVARKVAAIKSFFHFLLAEGLLEDNPAAAVNIPPVDKRLPHPLSAEGIISLLAEPAKSSTPKALRDKALLELMYATGMRASEVLNLKVDAVDLETGTVRCSGKGSRERVLPLRERARKALDLYLKYGRAQLLGGRDEEALFINNRGRPLTRQGLWLIVREYAAAAGIERRVTPRVLRHSFAAHMLDDGTELRELQQWLGHASISSTYVYTQVVTRRGYNEGLV